MSKFKQQWTSGKVCGACPRCPPTPAPSGMLFKERFEDRGKEIGDLRETDVATVCWESGRRGFAGMSRYCSPLPVAAPAMCFWTGVE